MHQVKKIGMGIFITVALFSSASTFAARIVTDGALNFQGYHEVHVDENFAAAYIDGKPASMTVINNNFVELRANHIIVSLAKELSGNWTASWTGKHRENGMLTPGLRPGDKSGAGQVTACDANQRKADGSCDER